MRHYRREAAARNETVCSRAASVLDVRRAFDELYRKVFTLINEFDPEVRQPVNDLPLSGRIGEKLHFLHLQICKFIDDADGEILEERHVFDATEDPAQV